VAAVRELEPEYQDRIDFVVIEAEETALRQDEIDELGFTELKHGLVGFSGSGEAVVKLPGHQFGKPEIEQAIQALLAAGS
jgi:hypothetical protein